MNKDSAGNSVQKSTSQLRKISLYLEQASAAQLVGCRLTWMVNSAEEGFELVSLLGAGGEGWVYRARRIGANADTGAVAVKVPVDPESSGHAAWRERQVKAWSAVHRVRAGVQFIAAGEAAVHQPGETAPPYTTSYVAFSEVPGNPLNIFAAHLDVPRKLELLVQACTAVSEFHRQGIWHGDLKPGNILVDNHGCPVVIDYGLCSLEDRFTQVPPEKRGAGTPEYMPPEQKTGGVGQMGTHCDVFAMGVVVREILWGTRDADMTAPLTGLRPATQSRLVRAVNQVLEPIGARRGQIGELIHELREVEKAAQAADAPRFPRSGKFPEIEADVKTIRKHVTASASGLRRAWWAAGILALAVLTGAVSLGVVAWNQYRYVQVRDDIEQFALTFHQGMFDKIEATKQTSLQAVAIFDEFAPAGLDRREEWPEELRAKWKARWADWSQRYDEIHESLRDETNLIPAMDTKLAAMERWSSSSDQGEVRKILSALEAMNNDMAKLDEPCDEVGGKIQSWRSADTLRELAHEIYDKNDEIYNALLSLLKR